MGPRVRYEGLFIPGRKTWLALDCLLCCVIAASLLSIEFSRSPSQTHYGLSSLAKSYFSGNVPRSALPICRGKKSVSPERRIRYQISTVPTEYDICQNPILPMKFNFACFHFSSIFRFHFENPRVPKDAPWSCANFPRFRIKNGLKITKI